MSTNVIVWAELTELPQASTAVHVLVIADSCAQAPAAVVSATLTVGLESQLSEAVTEGATGTAASHSMVVSAGVPARVGEVVSMTVIV